MLLGELVVKTGRMMCAGYFKDPERTSCAFTADGLYKTGDLVRMTGASGENPTVDVVGRAKTSIKLGNGRWVQPEPLEDICRQLTNVRDMFLHGDSQNSVLVAVVAMAPGKRGSRDELLDGFKALAEAEDRPPSEHIQGVIMSDEIFSRDNSLFNSTGKLHRRNLLDRFRDLCHSALVDAEIRASAGPLDHSRSFTAQGGTLLGAARIAALYHKLGVPVSRCGRAASAWVALGWTSFCQGRQAHADYSEPQGGHCFARRLSVSHRQHQTPRCCSQGRQYKTIRNHKTNKKNQRRADHKPNSNCSVQFTPAWHVQLWSFTSIVF